jgi:8-oxo-dGTP diphosphatase
MTVSHDRESVVGEPRIRVAAVVSRDDEILLVRHVKDGDSYWLLPGGGVEYGEPMGEALTREVLEETGLRVTPGNLLLAVDSIAPDGSRHIVNLYFRAEVAGGELKRGEDPRVAEACFVPLAELADLRLYPPVGEELKDLLADDAEGAPYLGSRWKEH